MPGLSKGFVSFNIWNALKTPLQRSEFATAAGNWDPAQTPDLTVLPESRSREYRLLWEGVRQVDTKIVYSTTINGQTHRIEISLLRHPMRPKWQNICLSDDGQGDTSALLLSVSPSVGETAHMDHVDFVINLRNVFGLNSF
ncbi:hypothetical protein EYC84_006317 [Monilinia fructicola]|uniref:Uncharacterized protein n=1 Tax=Monilinia fructicola TaxID=38448 RepID=A0A5M9K7V5_MONFR|nr:hypothetical protein EYC84_006317 [Monilinia fructicola]